MASSRASVVNAAKPRFNLRLCKIVCCEIAARRSGIFEMAPKILFQNGEKALPNNRAECFEEHIYLGNGGTFKVGAPHRLIVVIGKFITVRDMVPQAIDFVDYVGNCQCCNRIEAGEFARRIDRCAGTEQEFHTLLGNDAAAMLSTPLRGEQGFECRSPQEITDLPVRLLEEARLKHIDCHFELPERSSHRIAEERSVEM